MHRRLAFALTALTLSAPVAAQSSDVSWGLFPFLEGNWDSLVPSIVNDAVANDVDTLYVSVFRATDPLDGDLWITDTAGTWNSSWGSVRPGGAGINLSTLIAAAHAQNIGVVGVIRCFDEDVQPTNAAHRAYLLDVIDYLTNSYRSDGKPFYDLDGLALDYIRFVGSSAGNNASIVTDFVGEIREKVGVLSLHAYLLANRFSFDGPVYNLNFNSYAATMNTLRSDFGQDWEGLAQHLDVLMPMTYTADGSIYTGYAEHFAFVQQAAAYANTAIQLGGFPWRRVTPVIKTYTSSGETTTPTTIDASVDGALAGGAEGYQSFRYGTMRSNASWMSAFSASATAGANRPLARASVSVQGFTVTVDASASTDLEDGPAGLEMQVDFDDDGSPDTAWLPLGSVQELVSVRGAQRIGISVRDSSGFVSHTTRRAQVGSTSLDVQGFFYSSFVGGPLPIQIDAGPAAAGSLYLTLGSLSGPTPGFTLQGFDVPINFDGWTDGMLGLLNSPVLQNGYGFLDANGRATVTFQVPGGILTPIALQQMTWAAIGADPVTQDVRFVTNADLIIIAP